MPREAASSQVAPASTGDVAFSVALCSPADRAEQARLFNACFKKPVTAAGLAWRYDHNPHGASISLLSRPAGGEGVCGYACSPRLALARGEESTLATVGETGDVMTHPAWRKRGLFSALDQAAMRRALELGWPLVFGLPNRRSAHIFLQLGWERIGTVRPWTFVLRADGRARAGRRPDGRWRALLAPLAARAGRAGRKKLAAAAAGLAIRALETFPVEVQDLSRAVERRHGFMVRRDKAYLEWRFLQSPSRLHRCLGVFDGAGAFAGYAVVQLPREDGVGYLVDVLAPEPSARAAAIEAGLAALESAGASLVRATALEGSAWARELAGCGFQPPRPDNHLTVILHALQPAHPLVAAARDSAGWHFTDGDRDDETMG